MAELVVTTAEGTVFRYLLGRSAVIGRHPECNIIISDPMASRRHCAIEQGDDGTFVLEDRDSANGTTLNGQPLPKRQPQPLNADDVILIGATRLVLQLPDSDAVRSKAMGMGTSILCLKDDTQGEDVNVDYALAAGKEALSEDEVTSTDLGQVKKVTQRLKLLVDLGQALGSTVDPRRVLQGGLDKLFDVFPQSERGFILLYGPDGQIPSSIASAEGGGDALESRRGPLSVQKIRNPVAGEQNKVDLSRTVVNRVREKRQSVLLSDATSDSAFSPAMSMLRLEIRSVMCAPLIAGDQDLGILYLDTKDSRHRFGRDDVGLLNAVAGQVAVVIKNAELAQAAAAEAANRQNLQRFLSPQLVERIMKGEENILELGGRMKHGTVFFSDLISFTSMASRMRPADVVALLNHYFKVMQNIIFSRGGTVDKCSGDQIMAFWGVLVDMPLAAAHAALAALEMQNAMFTFNLDLASDDQIVKPPWPLGHGIGLNTGDFIAGNIGSERKIEYTVIGDAVNLAQRLESISGRGQVFLGRGTYDEIKHLALVFRMPDCPVKNVDMPIEVYSLRGLRVPGAGGAGLSVANPGDKTVRVEPATAEMLFSLPCVMAPEGEAEIPALVTGMALSIPRRRGFFRVLSERPLPAGAAVTLRWRVQEKPSLPEFAAQVQSGWTPDGQAAAPQGQAGPEGASLIDVQPAQGSVILRGADLPDDIISFGAGAVIPSDLNSPEEIIRE